MPSNATVSGVRLFLDILLLIVVATPAIVFKYSPVNASKRGFFCDDTSIKYPYHDSTVSTVAVVLIGGFVNVFFFVICEIVNYRVSVSSNPLPSERVCNLPVNRCVHTILGLIWGLAFGMFSTTSLTDVGKYTIGRLRPHFIDGCKISPDLTTLCAANGEGYITNFTCLQEDHEIYDDLRLSFPSGHASMAAFCSVFLVSYIQQRLPRLSVTYLLKTVLQIGVIGLAWFCALSRVMDNKHHPTDVLAGSILGTLVALCYGRYVMKSFRDPYANGPFKRRGFSTEESLELANLGANNKSSQY